MPRISVGMAYACATVGGALKCWGNAYGWPLFTTSTLDFGTPAQPTTVFASGIDDFAARTYGVECHLTGGAVVCSGGTWGLGQFQTRTLVTSGATSVKLGNLAACAMTSPDLRCWDTSAFGTQNTPTTWIALSDPTVTEYAISLPGVCAIVAGGAVVCTPTPGASGASRNIIAAGATKIALDQVGNGCAVVGTDLQCWAAPSTTASGFFFYDPDLTQDTNLAAHVVLSDVVDVDMAMNASASAICVVKTDSSVACWGDLGLHVGQQAIQTILPSGAASIHMMRSAAGLIVAGMKDGTVKSRAPDEDTFTDVNLK